MPFRLPGVQSSETFVYLNVLQQKFQWMLERDGESSRSRHGGVIERSVAVDGELTSSTEDRRGV